jgi:hypothetical protein
MAVEEPLRTYLSAHCKVGTLYRFTLVVANDIMILYVDTID